MQKFCIKRNQLPCFCGRGDKSQQTSKNGVSSPRRRQRDAMSIVKGTNIILQGIHQFSFVVILAKQPVLSMTSTTTLARGDLF
jgi:hypothetical protein